MNRVIPLVKLDAVLLETLLLGSAIKGMISVSTI